MRIYTKTGDTGKTSVIGGRLEKDDPRVEAYGTVDELNSWIGMSTVSLNDEKDADIVKNLAEIQQNLFDCCADLALAKPGIREYRIKAEHVEEVEKLIEHYDQMTENIDYFIIPGGCRASARLHVCRTVARRAERCVVTLLRQDKFLNEEVLKYLNRLSDLFFVMARVCNVRADIADTYYIRSKKAFRHANKTQKNSKSV